MQGEDITAVSDQLPTYPVLLAERYEPVRELGRGAFGVVYLSMDSELRREVAVKLLLPEKLDREEPLERFMREARLMSRIKSRYVAEIYDFGEEGGRPYLVSRYVNGKSLKDLKRRRGGTVPFAEANRLIDQVLQGLEACHQEGIVHRDLKPANILLTRQGEVALSDFGLGRADEDRTLTASGTVVGTPAYMAPEQMQGMLTCVAMDLYAVALIYGELLTGQVPMLESNLSETFLKRLNGPPEGWLHSRVPEVTPELEELLGRTLDPDPSRRPSSARTLLEALRFHVGDSRALPALPAEITSGPPGGERDGDSLSSGLASGGPAQEGGKRWGGLLGGLLLLSVGVGFWGGFQSVGPAGSGADPAREREEAWRARERWSAFRDLVAKLHAEPRIARCLELNQDVPPREAWETWIDAREAFRSMVEKIGRTEVLRSLDPARATTEDVNAVSAVTLLERLLSRTARPESIPLYQGIEPPGFSLLKERLYQTRPMRAFRSGLLEKSVWRSQSLFQLSQSPQRWDCLRKLEDQIIPWKGRKRSNTGLRLRLPSGEIYQNPTKEIPDGAVLFVRPEHDRDFTLQSKREIRLPLEEADGDLVFFVTGHGWTLFNHLVVRVKGKEATLRLMESFPPAPPSSGRRMAFQSLLFRIPAERVPRGLRQLEISAIGIQSIGNPEYVVYLLEVYRQLEGPLPEVFREELLEGARPEELPGDWAQRG